MPSSYTMLLQVDIFLGGGFIDRFFDSRLKGNRVREGRTTLGKSTCLGFEPSLLCFCVYVYLRVLYHCARWTF